MPLRTREVSVGPHPAINSATGEAVKELPAGTVPMHSSPPLLGHFEEVALLASSVYPAVTVVEAIGSEVVPQSAVFLLRPHPAETCNNGQGDGSNWCFFVINYLITDTMADRTGVSLSSTI